MAGKYPFDAAQKHSHQTRQEKLNLEKKKICRAESLPSIKIGEFFPAAKVQLSHLQHLQSTVGNRATIQALSREPTVIQRQGGWFDDVLGAISNMGGSALDALTNPVEQGLGDYSVETDPSVLLRPKKSLWGDVKQAAGEGFGLPFFSPYDPTQRNNPWSETWGSTERGFKEAKGQAKQPTTEVGTDQWDWLTDGAENVGSSAEYDQENWLF